MAEVWDNDDNDGTPEYDPSQFGPEYWLNRNAKFRYKTFSRCIKCGIKQEICVDDEGVYAVCPSRRCGYQEVVVDWKV